MYSTCDAIMLNVWKLDALQSFCSRATTHLRARKQGRYFAEIVGRNICRWISFFAKIFWLEKICILSCKIISPFLLPPTGSNSCLSSEIFLVKHYCRTRGVRGFEPVFLINQRADFLVLHKYALMLFCCCTVGSMSFQYLYAYTSRIQAVHICSFMHCATTWILLLYVFSEESHETAILMY